MNLPSVAGEVEGALRMVDEHAPAVGPDEPLIGERAPWVCELIAALTVAHAVGLALAIELRAALSEAEQRAFRQEERHIGRLGVEGEALHGPPFAVIDMNRRRRRREAHREVASAHGLERPSDARAARDALCRVTARASPPFVRHDGGGPFLRWAAR